MPIIGITASSITPFLGDFESIATVVISTATDTVTFNNIPQTYKHLQIRALVGKAASGNNQIVSIRFNNDSSAIYNVHNLLGTGAAAVSDTFNNVSPANSAGVFCLRADSSVNTFCGVVSDLLDYTDTNKFSTLRSLYGFDTNGTANGASQFGFVGMYSTLYRSTNAVSRIDIIGFNTNTFPTNSHFALYGIKG